MRSGMVIATMIALVAAPGGGAYTYYLITKDPTAQPMGLTQESLAGVTGIKRVEIVAQVRLPPAADNAAMRRRIAEQLSAGFRAYGLELRTEFAAPLPGRTGVTYEVGSSRIGPFALANAAEGVKAAVAAYRMNGGG